MNTPLASNALLPPRNRVATAGPWCSLRRLETMGRRPARPCASSLRPTPEHSIPHSKLLMIQGSSTFLATPMVVHLLYRLDFGGLEVVLSECVNRLPGGRYRHAIICLTDYTDFAKCIVAPNVTIHSLNKKPGLAPETHFHLWKLLRKLRPAVLHTYNLAAIEYAFTAALAGVPVRIHAEHGRDVSDMHGTNVKHNLLRKALRPFIDAFVPVSRDLHTWLRDDIKVPQAKNRLIVNGVDTERFKPASDQGGLHQHFVIGTVSRIHDIKNHQGLIDAFLQLREMVGSDQIDRLRLIIVGDGPLLPQIRQRVIDEGLEGAVQLTGARTDVSALMQGFSVFVLPSLAEGMPITILEAMATGLPVVASAVGGIPDLVVHRETGILVPSCDAHALADALRSYYENPQLALEHGVRARERIQENFSIQAMIGAYVDLYDTLCRQKSGMDEASEQCVE